MSSLRSCLPSGACRMSFLCVVMSFLYITKLANNHSKLTLSVYCGIHKSKALILLRKNRPLPTRLERYAKLFPPHKPAPSIPPKGRGLIARACAFARCEVLHCLRPSSILVLFTLTLPVWAQEFTPEQVIFPITDFKPDIKHLALFSMKFGTGFCLDQDCRFVGTNYHVAKVMGKRVRIRGVLSAHRYLDSGPDDAGARTIDFPGGGSLQYTPAHDLGIYEMQHPLKRFHGIGFGSDDLEKGQGVDIYGYPFNGNPKRGLVRWHGKFIGKTRQDLLAFTYEEGRVRSGTSGGVVVDSKTNKIIGILNEIGDGKDRIALAVPVKELAEFVARAQPYLQGTLFPKTVFVSPVAPDLYPPYVSPRAENLSQRALEPPEVIRLRFTAQHLADSMRNFIAIETFAWGHDNFEPEITEAYETLIVDGFERWRRPGAKKFKHHVPIPLVSPFITPGGEWSDLPWRIGTELKLKVHPAPDGVVGGRNIHVFQYEGKIENGVCGMQSVIYFLWAKVKFYDCHGEVWTDEAGFILRISESYDSSGSGRFRGMMTYGWLEKEGRQYPVPVTLTTEYMGRYWCRALFTDYEMFGVKTHLMLANNPEQEYKSTFGAQ